jgi:hypothetical protein
MSLTLKAMPGRLILRFPKPVEQKGSIIVPIGYQQRPEFGVIHDIGDALNEEQQAIVAFLSNLQEQGIPLCVSYGSGVGYWHGKENALDEDEYGWLKDYRSYRLEEPAAFLVEDE